MHKLLLRIVAFILIPCLLADTTLAAPLSQQHYARHDVATLPIVQNSEHFSEEALSLVNLSSRPPRILAPGKSFYALLTKSGSSNSLKPIAPFRFSFQALKPAAAIAGITLLSSFGLKAQTGEYAAQHSSGHFAVRSLGLLMGISTFCAVWILAELLRARFRKTAAVLAVAYSALSIYAFTDFNPFAFSSWTAIDPTLGLGILIVGILAFQFVNQMTTEYHTGKMKFRSSVGALKLSGILEPAFMLYVGTSHFLSFHISAILPSLTLMIVGGTASIFWFVRLYLYHHLSNSLKTVYLGGISLMRVISIMLGAIILAGALIQLVGVPVPLWLSFTSKLSLWAIAEVINHFMYKLVVSHPSVADDLVQLIFKLRSNEHLNFSKPIGGAIGKQLYKLRRNLRPNLTQASA